RPRDAAVRETLAWCWTRKRSIASRRPEALVRADMTARTDQAVRAQRGVECGVPCVALFAAEQRALFRERCMTGVAAESIGGATRQHLDELAGDTRPQRLPAKARAPGRELPGVAAPARRWCARGAHRRGPSGRGA